MNTRRDVLTGMGATAAALIVPAAAWARQPEVFATGGVAIHGYDPVGYFTHGQPVEGLADHQVLWHGAIWRFASAQSMGAFEADPYRFAPRYGGYCAYAMAQGAVATTVPEAWTVHEDRLYLNFSTGVRDLWRQDIPGLIAAADAHWPAALDS